VALRQNKVEPSPGIYRHSCNRVQRTAGRPHAFPAYPQRSPYVVCDYPMSLMVSCNIRPSAADYSLQNDSTQRLNHTGATL